MGHSLTSIASLAYCKCEVGRAVDETDELRLMTLCHWGSTDVDVHTTTRRLPTTESSRHETVEKVFESGPVLFEPVKGEWKGDDLKTEITASPIATRSTEGTITNWVGPVD